MRAERVIPWGPRALILVVGVALVTTACGGSSPSTLSGPTTPPYRPTGSLIMEVGRFEHHIDQVALPAGTSTRFQIAEYSSYFGGAGVGPDGTVYALSTYFDYHYGSTSQLFAGKPGPGGARPVGAQLNQVSGFQLRGTTGVGFGCYNRFRSIYVIDLAGDGTWRKVAEGCAAALSADGRQMAWVDHGVVWKMSLPDGGAHRVLDLATIPGLAATGVTRVPDGFTTIQWGPAGLAVMVGQGTIFALIVAPAQGQPMVIPLGMNQPGEMTWQPRGSLLAFGDFVTKFQTAEVRLLDVRTGALSQVASTENFGQFQWSPDGRVIAVVRDDSVTSFVDLEGRQLGVLPVGGGIDAWVR